MEEKKITTNKGMVSTQSNMRVVKTTDENIYKMLKGNTEENMAAIKKQLPYAEGEKLTKLKNEFDSLSEYLAEVTVKLEAEKAKNAGKTGE